MKTTPASRRFPSPFLLVILSLILLRLAPAQAQVLLNVDFGVGAASGKVGFAATGLATNDFWNLHAHYNPRFTPGQPPVPNHTTSGLKLSDKSDSAVSIAVSNAPGVWGNASGDPMFDSFVFAPNGSNILVTVRALEAGRYHSYLYGHADPDATPEQNSVFTLRSGTNTLGPLAVGSAGGWKASLGWQEGRQFIVFRDVPVEAGQPVIIEVAPGPGGVAVLNGLQIISRGSSPPKTIGVATLPPPATYTNLIVREVRYEGKVTDSEARFTATVEVESLTTNEVSAVLFQGDVAVFAPELPAGIRLTRESAERTLGKAVSISPRSGTYRLHCAKSGVHTLKLEVIARITKAEPWNHISFNGPPASVASLKVEGNAGVELELLNGALLEGSGATAKASSSIAGIVGADRVVSLRWQSKTTEIARKSLITVDTAASAVVSPTVIKFTTVLHYELLQASVSRLTVGLPPGHTLTRVQGDGIRDWSTAKATAAARVPADWSVLTVDFAKPVEKTYSLTLATEQPVEATPLLATLLVPQPLDIERESGTFTLAADDTVVEVESTTGVRQVNASTGTLFAWRFNARPFSIAARLKRIEPVLETAARVTARLEESRLVVSHAVNLSVLKAGIYTVELTYPTNFNVTDVRGGNVEDWKATGGKLKVNFTQRVLGVHRLDLTLEQPHKTFPAQINVGAVRVTGATKETAFIGAASAAGIRLKTAELTNAREIPIAQLNQRAGDEALAFTAEAPDWKLALATERLPARAVAEVFNLVTVGDGLVGGSATIRFGILNQGVQEFKVSLPAHWKNVEFTGPNIRRKELGSAGVPPVTNIWTISLQDKAWGGYTLVVTYDYQFDPKKAVLDLAGAHCDGVERETGSLAVTAAANLKLQPKPAAEPLRAIDQTELAETDRALITRPVLLAYRYTGGGYALTADAARFDEERVLDAVADRTQITSVVTEAAEMLTQASFMVKNNEKQFQRFKLPAGANFWGCYVNNQPSKAERDGDWLQIPLPRGENRDEAFAVDIVYAQKLAALDQWLPQHVALTAPATDVPNTYAEWQLFVPATKRVSSFGGTMSIARGTTYGLREAWDRFLSWWEDVWGQLLGGLAFLAVVYFIARSVKKNGMKGFGTAAVVLFVCAIMGGMLLPALSKAKAKASRIKSVSNLKQIGLGARVFANDNADRFPDNFEEMMNELGSDKILTDPDSGERYVWVGAGKPEHGDALLAYSPVDNGGRNAVFADGSVRQLSSSDFAQAQQKDAQIVAQSAVRQAQGVGMKKDVQALALQSDGNALVGGGFSTFNGVAARGRIKRLNADGSLDSSYRTADAPGNAPAKPMAKQMADKRRESGEVEQLARVDKLSDRLEAARQEPMAAGRGVEVTAKWSEKAKVATPAEVASRMAAERKAASGPMPMTPPPVASPVPEPLTAAGALSLADGIETRNFSVPAIQNSLQVQRAGGSPGTVTLGFLSANGTAVAGSDAVNSLSRSVLSDSKDQSGAFQLGMLAAGVAGGGGAGSGGFGFARADGEAAQTAVGMRSIRIDIPRSGQAFTFTKVLNLKSEPLGIEMSLMPLGKFRAAQSAGQLALFLGGLLWALIHWRRADRSSFGIALGLALALAGVVWLGLSARTLHWVLIAAVPLAGAALLCWLAWRFWPRGKVNGEEKMVRSEGSVTPVPMAESKPSVADSGSGPVPPAAALLAFALLTTSALAQPTPYSSPLTIHNSPVTLQSATYTGTIREKAAEFTATLVVSSTGTNQTFTLFGEDVAIQSFTAKTGEARLVREGGFARVWLPKSGAVTVELKLFVRLDGDVTKRRLGFGLPPALASQFTALIDEPDADVEFPSAVAFKRTPAGKQTRVEAIIGSTDRVDLAWTPRMKRLAEMEATVFAQTATLVTVGGGVVNSRAVVDYQIAQGELRQAKVRLPAGQRLLRVEGEGIRTWELLTEGGAEVLSVDLLKGATANWRLTIETEKPLPTLPATVKVEVPVVQDVRREAGLVAARGAEETSLAVETAEDLQRVELAEFNRASKLNYTDLVSAFRYLRSTFQLTVKAEAVQPQVEALVLQRLRLGAEQLTLAAEFSYTVKKAGIFQLRAQIPVGWRIETVAYADATLRAKGSALMPINNWTEKTEAGVRVLEVPLRERTQGQVSLLVVLARTVKEAPKTLAVPAVHPLGVHKLNGFVSVSTEAGISVKTESFDGLTEVPAASMPVGIYKGSSEIPTLAFKFLSPDPTPMPAWKLGVATEQLESWVRAEVVNLISVSETLVSGRALVRLDIANAPVKEFRLKIPLTVTNVDITGPNIRRRDQTGEVWRVELQHKLRGQHTFMVTWEQPRAAKTNAPVEVPAVEAVGVERETGSVAILAKPPLQVSEKSASTELVRIDARELPEWAAAYATGAKGEQVVLAWRYLRPGWKLAVTPQRFAEAAVLQALVDSARLTTVVADDGQMMTEVSLSMRNNGRQFLEVELPTGAIVWSAFVNGQPVRPTKQGGKLLLPMEQAGGDAALPIEFTYVAADKFPKRKGHVAFASPKFDVPLKNARWELLLPPDYEYTEFAGTMGRDLSGATVVTVNYSAAEYSKQEAKVRADRDSESKSSLGRLNSLLSSGKLNEANNEWFNFKRNPGQGGGNKGAEVDEMRQLKEVEVQLRRSQASNLVQAQQAYSLDNAKKFGAAFEDATSPSVSPSGDGKVTQQQLSRYDTDAAEQQLEKLQKAQEVTVATVQPLRVNLPLRGQRHAFTQVLQTEVNKPMTVEFTARNQKASGWLKPIALTIAAFLALWVAVAVFAQRRAA
ncbi:MAG: hypothetical protein RL514_2568 [Verrucomicrobiota bacterium]|jgi:hypothetical protein